MKTLDEALEVTAQVLIRCAVMGVIVLLIWWGALELFGDLAYSVHSEIVPISDCSKIKLSAPSRLKLGV